MVTNRTACILRRGACGIAIVVLAACSSGGRKTVAIGSGAESRIDVAANGRSLNFVVPTCHGRPTTQVVENGTEVHLLVTSDTTSSDKCADGASVTLDAPLGTRRVVDDKTGKSIATRQSAG